MITLEYVQTSLIRVQSMLFYVISSSCRVAKMNLELYHCYDFASLPENNLIILIIISCHFTKMKFSDNLSESD